MKVESYPHIVAAFQQSEAGQSLQGIFRWSAFRTGETDLTWRQTLGATANDFAHGQLMYGIARRFLEYEPDRFSSIQQELFLHGVICHDWGEALINDSGVGDISAQVKTAAEEKIESIIARQAIASLNLPLEIKIDLLAGYAQVVEGGDPQLHHAFKALEKAEYVITAMKVYQSGKRMNEQGIATIENEIPLIARVLVIDLAKVLDVYIAEYPNSLGVHFYKSGPLIDEMLEYVYPWLQATKEWAGKPVDHEELASSFLEKWTQFKETFQHAQKTE